MAIEATVTSKGTGVNVPPTNQDLGFDLHSAESKPFPKTEDINLESEFVKETNRRKPEVIEPKPTEVVPEEEAEVTEEETEDEAAIIEEIKKKEEELIELKKKTLKAPAAKPTVQQEEIKPPEAPKWSVDQVREQAKMHSVISTLKSLGYAVKEDGSDLATHYHEVQKQNALYAQQVLDYANRYADETAKAYEQAEIIPRKIQQEKYQIQEFCKFYAKEFPDFNDYMDEMDALAPALLDKYPHLRGRPDQSIPILYQKAKEKKLVAAARTVNKDKKATMETGSARRTAKGTRSTPSSEAELDRVFGPGKSDAAAGFWKSINGG